MENYFLSSKYLGVIMFKMKKLEKTFNGFRRWGTFVVVLILVLKTSLSIHATDGEDATEATPLSTGEIRWVMENEPLQAGQRYVDLAFRLDWGSVTPVPFGGAVILSLDFPLGALSLAPDEGGNRNPALAPEVPGFVEVLEMDHPEIEVTSIMVSVVGLGDYHGEISLEARMSIGEGFLENEGDSIEIGVFRANMQGHPGVRTIQSLVVGATGTEQRFIIEYQGNAQRYGTVTGVPERKNDLLPGTHELDTYPGPVHSNVDGLLVHFLGWSKSPTSRIFATGEEVPPLVEEVTIVNAGVTVYAVWAWAEDIGGGGSNGNNGNGGGGNGGTGGNGGSGGTGGGTGGTGGTGGAGGTGGGGTAPRTGAGDIAKTGDGANMLLWLIILGVGFVGFSTSSGWLVHDKRKAKVPVIIITDDNNVEQQITV